MKRKYMSLVLGGFLLIGAGCENEVEYRIDETLPSEEYAPLDDMTVQMNGKMIGHLVCDEEHTYFVSYEEGFGRVYKKHRTGGELTLLVERPLPEKGDLLYSQFHVRGEYLYFILFDGGSWGNPDKELLNAMCRVRTDGSAPFEVMYKPENSSEFYYWLGDKAYVDVSLDYGFVLKQYDWETGKVTELFSREDESDAEKHTYYAIEFIHEGYVYYYANQDKYTLHRCRLDGTGDEALFQVDGFMLKMAVVNDRIYISDYEGEKLYAVNLDGSDLHLEQEGMRITYMNVHKGMLYLSLDASSDYDAGLYAYRSGYKMPQPLYKGGEMVFGPIIDGNGDIWGTLPLEEVRFGQLHRLDVEKHTWSVVK